MKNSRRSFLTKLGAGLASIPFAGIILSKSVLAQKADVGKIIGVKEQPTACKKVATPLAKLDYVHLAKDYKGKNKFPQNSNCANCSFYKVQKGQKHWGKCSMLAQACVYEEGLCKSWRINKQLQKS